MTTKRLLIGAAVTVLTSFVLAATGWIYSAVASIPMEYVNKDEYARGLDRNEKDHDRIEKKIDKIIDILLERGEK